jgi:hypothetical protein
MSLLLFYGHSSGGSGGGGSGTPIGLLLALTVTGSTPPPTVTNSGIARLRSAAWAREHNRAAEWAEVARRQAVQYQSAINAERRKAKREALARKAEQDAARALLTAPPLAAPVLGRKAKGELTAVQAVDLIRREIERLDELSLSHEMELAAFELAEQQDEDAAMLVIMLGA